MIFCKRLTAFDKNLKNGDAVKILQKSKYFW